MEMTRLRTSTTSQEIPQKARCFVIDKDSGHPLPGVVIVAEAEPDENVRVPLGMLVSDEAGYVSFDLNSVHESGITMLVHLWLYPMSDEITRADVAKTYRQGEVGNHVLLKVDARLATQTKHHISLPSVQNPDIIDWKLSPYSFSTKVDVATGEGACETISPSTAAERDYRFYRVIRRSDLSASTDGAITITPIDPLRPGPAGIGELEAGVGPVAIANGEVLEFRQRWFPLPHSLGQISYSLPLAPCESVNLAVIDWSRRDEATRTDTITATETLLHSERRDREIEETIEAALDEKQGGWSLMGGTAGAGTGSTSGTGSASATVPIYGIPVNLSGSGTASSALSALFSVGGGISNSWGERDLLAKSQQDLHDRIKQSTSVVRSLNSTVIVEGTQEEHNVLQTRTVTNHNHCHALTVQYYEVLRNFRLETKFEGKRPAILIPYKTITFDWEKALRFRTILEPVLLDPDLTSCFDAIVRLHYCKQLYEADTKPTETTTTPKPKPGISRYELTLVTGDRETNGEVLVQLGLKDGKWYDLYYKPGLDHKSGHGRTSSQPGHQLEKYSREEVNITSGQCIGLKLSDIKRVRVTWWEWNYNDAWNLDEIIIRYQVEDQSELQPTPLVFQKVEKLDNDQDSFYHFSPFPVGDPQTWTSDQIELPADTTEEPDLSTTLPEKITLQAKYTEAEDNCCEQHLLTHLNNNLGFYNRAIWLFQDPTERRILLDAALTSHPDIRDGIDDVPLAVSGNYVAFAYNKQSESGNGRVDTPVTLPNPAEDIIMPNPAEDIISFPTRGLFAEAQLSHCNSCEKRDATRFWQWEESPCEKPPTIEGITPGPRGQAPSVEPANLPAPVVQVMQPPSAPDPVGLAAALNLLGQPNIFRDMSGMSELSELLSGLASGAVDLAKAQQLAAAAKNKMQEGPAAASGQSGGRSGPSEPDAGEQIDKLDAIDYALNEKGLIDERQAGNAAEGVLGGTLLASSDPSFVPSSTAITGDSRPLDGFGPRYSELQPWQRLISFRPSLKIQGDLVASSAKVLPIENGSGPINLDHYEVVVTRLPQVAGRQWSADELLTEMRLKFNECLDTDVASISPYDSSNESLWRSKNPRGAMMHWDMNLATYNLDDGSVVCSNFNTEEWIFSTVETKDDFTHPVSGNRAFGYRKSEKGTYYFYIQGADRITLARDVYLFKDSIFGGGHRLWRSWQERFPAFVGKRGGEAISRPYYTSARYDWDTIRKRYFNPTGSWKR